VVQAAFRLIIEIRDHSGTETPLLAAWLSDYRELARRAVTEDDLRDDDPDAVAQLLMETLAGVRLLAAVTGHSDDLPARLTTAWDLLLPGLVDDTKLDHFRELVTRQVAHIGDRSTPPRRRRPERDAGPHPIVVADTVASGRSVAPQNTISHSARRNPRPGAAGANHVEDSA
jgi:hypothetical protein